MKIKHLMVVAALVSPCPAFAGPGVPPTITKPKPKPLKPPTLAKTIEELEDEQEAKEAKAAEAAKGVPASPEQRDKMARDLEKMAERMPPDRAAKQLKHAADIRAGRVKVYTRPATAEDLEPMLKHLEEMKDIFPPQAAKNIDKQIEDLKSKIKNLKNPKPKTEK